MNRILALEKVFAAEVEGRLPFQSRSKIYSELAIQGYLENIECNMGSVTVKGYALTHLGRLEYCGQCKGDIDE